MRLWCFDPGLTTGTALFQDNNLRCWGETKLWRGLDAKIQLGDTIIYEDVFWKTPHFNPVGIRVIGVLQYLAHQKECQIFERSPGLIVGVKKWPIYDFSSIKSQHSIDAICHGIIYLGPKYVTLPEKFLTRKT